MTQLWYVNFQTDIGYALDEEVLVHATTEDQARNRVVTYINECNANCDEIEILGFTIHKIELHDKWQHGPKELFDII